MPRPLIPDRRERILDAAEALVLDRGFDAMSIATIAEHTGIAKGAVYREFASKTDILGALLRRAADRMGRRVQEAIGENPRLSHGYLVTVQALLADPLMTAAYLDDQGVLGAQLETVTDDRFRVHHEGIVAWIRDSQDRGVFSAEVDAEHVALALSSATIGLLSLSKLVGPLSSAQLEGALTALAAMIAAFETGPDGRP